MNPNEPKQAASATMAIGYITVGALMDVWTAVYWIYVRNQNPSRMVNLWCAGFFLTGLVLMGIGFFIGRIGRSARQAEVVAPPAQIVTPAVAATTQAPAGNGVPFGVAQTTPLAPSPTTARSVS